MSFISHQPTFTFTFTFTSSFPSPSFRLKCLKHLSFPKKPSSKSVFTGGFISKSPLSEQQQQQQQQQQQRRRLLHPNTTSTFLVRNNSASTFGNSSNGGDDDDEGVQKMHQHEAILNGSSETMAAAGGDLDSILNHLSIWLAGALFSFVMLLRHDAKSLWAGMGYLVNIGLSLTLKRLLNQERPVSTLRSDPGMPSSHAQCIFFTVMFAFLSMVELVGVNELTLIAGGLVFSFSSYLSWLRVSQKLHTASQVLVGAAVGSVFFLLWIWSWDALVLKLFVSFLWVRIFVVLAAAVFCIGLFVSAVQYWLIDES